MMSGKKYFLWLKTSTYVIKNGAKIQFFFEIRLNLWLFS